VPDLLERLKSALAGRYAVESEIGRGGMATVFLAEDLKHHRKVALKVLHPELSVTLAADRFLNEIEIVAGLEHPHILTLIDSGEADGLLYYIMPYVAGESLRQRLERVGQLPVEEAVRVAVEVADGLDFAHRHGVIHRDVKPGNILLSDKHAVITDFGIARAITVAQGERVTSTGLVVGTPLYASPEQAAGAETLDGRTDVYSLGCVLYEILSGEVPLSAPTPQAMQARRLSETPGPIHRMRHTVPLLLDQVISKALARLPADRWKTAEQFGQALTTVLVASTHSVGADLGFATPVLTTDPAAAASVRRRPRTFSMITAAILALGVVGAWVLAQRVAPATGDADQTAQVVTGLDEISRLRGERDYPGAYAIARELDDMVTNDSLRAYIWARVSRPVTFRTEPPGAFVLRRDYAPADAEWEELGRTPLEVERFPRGVSRVRFELEGYLPREIANWSGYLAAAPPFKLDTEETLPRGMTRVGGTVKIWAPGLEQLDSLVLGDFFMSIHEVTNRQYKAFLDAGGYRDSACWHHAFVRDGRTLSFDEAIAEFTDLTGRLGPSTWEVGIYPEGAADLPVGGVNWYEAEAYACFAGRELPTIYHWYAAAKPDDSGYVVPLSNYDSKGPAPVGEYAGVSQYGVYDLAGNVREWTRNADGENRFILGGGWNDLKYSFNDAITLPAFDRSPSNGIRLVQYSDTTSLAAASTSVERPFRDYYSESPVSDDVFELYRQMYAYDRAPLNATVISSDTTSDWIREDIEMDAAYGGERLTAILFLPRAGEGPYQTVVYFPGSGVIYVHSRGTPWVGGNVGWVVQSGRALMLPVYKGTFERASDLHTDVQDEANTYRDHVIWWAKDLGRSIDYLETRPDIDADRLAYIGHSWGGMMGGIMTAVEPRFKASVLVAAGLAMQSTQPMVDPFNFLPRVTVPTLILNGRHDSWFAVESSLRPFFDNLGTSEQDKKFIIVDGGHPILRDERNLVIRETLDWYDRYLGPVE